MTRLLHLALLCLVGGFGVGVTPAQANDRCSAAVAEFDAARSSGDLDLILRRHGDLPAAGCEEKLLFCAGNSVAVAHLAAGYAAAEAGASVDEIRSILSAGKRFGSPWQLLVGLADLSLNKAQTEKDGAAFTDAATYYQDALNSLSEPQICSGEAGIPSVAEIESIHTRMQEALMLAPQFEVVRTRSGACGGIFLQNIRGFTPTFRPLPVNFVFDETDFTPAGEKAAAVLLACLKETSPAQVVLSGHTDAKGTDAYNLELSRRRLARVAEYLVEGGYEGELVLIPKGESEPFEADDPTAYDEAEIDQLNRRVVLRQSKS